MTMTFSKNDRVPLVYGCNADEASKDLKPHPSYHSNQNLIVTLLVEWTLVLVQFDIPEPLFIKYKLESEDKLFILYTLLLSFVILLNIVARTKSEPTQNLFKLKTFLRQTCIHLPQISTEDYPRRTRKQNYMKL